MATLKRTFHPVGHGAFYTERFYDNLGNNIANIVFDCGCFETAKAGVSPEAFQQRINDIITSCFNKGDKIDALFVSHFHQDHINGINKLMEHCDVKRIFIPKLTPQIVLEAYLGNAMHYEDIDTIEDFLHICQDKEKTTQIGEFNFDENVRFEVLDISTVKAYMDSPSIITLIENNWQFIPFNSKNKKGEIVEAIKLDERFADIWEDDETIDIDKLSTVIQDIGIEECKKIYQSVYGEKHNSYSMTLYSGVDCGERCCLPACLHILEEYTNKMCTINCLYTGDYEASDGFASLQKFYSYFWNNIGLIQVPHHGSEKNLNNGLYSLEKICIISAGETDKYGHPDDATLDVIWKNKCLPIIITENPKTKQQFIYNL
ncbi:MAG: MBL fold metallo-hydrolase [Rikenellaceae bacterium]|nr:MBL fold metallo-hydrolase [Rikenellaceae bacterium]